MSVDKEKTAKRISEIQIAMDRLKQYASMNVKTFIKDDEKVAAAKYHLLTVIEGCISICTHISTKEIHKIPEGYGACFKLLADNNIIDSDLGNNLSKMAGFRNLLIHQYWNIDDQKVHQFIVSGLDDIKTYIKLVGDKYLKL